ncbi:MAG: hypothetical protein JW958_13570 [Candidatus Eisenbacteria bacterium]|nr:hypothetical protein [Candidatus Eisenbacteria bacterium]
MHHSLKCAVLICALFIVSLSLTVGCGGKDADERAAEKVAEKILEKAGDGKADVDIKDGRVSVKGEDFEVEAGEASTWPEDLPIEIPRFTYGKVVGVSRMSTPDQKGWKCDIHFKELDSEAAVRYKADLEKSGWEIQALNQSVQGGMLMAGKGEKDRLVFMYDGEKHEGTVMVISE